MAEINIADRQTYFEVVDGWAGNLQDGGVSAVVQPAAEHYYNKRAPAAAVTPFKLGAIAYTAIVATVEVALIPLLDATVNLDADKQAPHQFWMCVEGNTPYQYSSLAGLNKVVLLRGHFAVRTAHVKGTPAVSTAVTPEHGAAGTVDATLPHNDVAGVPGVNEGRLMAAAAGDPIVGWIRKIETIEGILVYTIEMTL